MQLLHQLMSQRERGVTWLTFPKLVDELIISPFRFHMEMILLQHLSTPDVPPDIDQLYPTTHTNDLRLKAHTPCPAQIHPPFPFSQKSHSSLHFQPHLFPASSASLRVNHNPSPPGGVIVNVPFFLRPVDVKSASSIFDTDCPTASWNP